MINSMTAFARKDQQEAWGSLTCEIRSVNHRYLEPQFRLPDALRELENEFREQLRERLSRGKVDVGMRLVLDEAAQALKVNMDLVRGLNEAANQVNRLLDNPAHINALDFLKWPGVLSVAEQDMDTVKAAARQVFQGAVSILMETRLREGERLQPLFSSRLERIQQLVGEVRQQMPALLDKQRANLLQRFHDAQLQADPDRLAQELVLMAQKSDVAEELDRLEAHVKEVAETLRKQEPVGRRLDFLMQELNREANTLGSKSMDTAVTNAAVELKVLIEQMREQVQNIE